QWRAGQQDAAAELFDRYASRLIALAQRQLSAKLNARVDAGDLVQSAYTTFFLGARDGQFALERSGDLWHLLVAITLHKVQNQLQYHTAAKRSIHREESLPAAGAAVTPETLLAREPSPEEATLLVATLDEVLAPLKPAQRAVIELKLQGYSLVEIVEATRLSTSTVRRVLQGVKDQLEAG
ncbi:MAG: RNA polymerase sigma factor, partial [Gemmataceae bacterium]